MLSKTHVYQELITGNHKSHPNLLIDRKGRIRNKKSGWQPDFSVISVMQEWVWLTTGLFCHNRVDGICPVRGRIFLSHPRWKDCRITISITLHPLPNQTNSPIHQFTNSPIHQFTISPIHKFVSVLLFEMSISWDTPCSLLPAPCLLS